MYSFFLVSLLFFLFHSTCHSITLPPAIATFASQPNQGVILQWNQNVHQAYQLSNASSVCSSGFLCIAVFVDAPVQGTNMLLAGTKRLLFYNVSYRLQTRVAQ